MVIASTTQPSSPQASLLIGADGTPLLPALPQQQRRPSQPQLIAQSPLPNSSLLPSLPTTAQPPASGSSTPTASPPLALAPTAAAATTAPTEPYRPASAKPPASRIPSFPLVDAYVPDANSTDRRHPRTLVPKDLGFPTAAMHGKVRKEDLDDRLLMATCAVLHGFENRALCPKEVAEVMLERDWLKNAYVLVVFFSLTSEVPRSSHTALLTSSSLTVGRHLSPTSRPASAPTSPALLVLPLPTNLSSLRSNSSALSPLKKFEPSVYTLSNAPPSSVALCGTSTRKFSDPALERTIRSCGAGRRSGCSLRIVKVSISVVSSPFKRRCRRSLPTSR
jgi:hypothetical protein